MIKEFKYIDRKISFNNLERFHFKVENKRYTYVWCIEIGFTSDDSYTCFSIDFINEEDEYEKKCLVLPTSKAFNAKIIRISR